MCEHREELTDLMVLFGRVAERLFGVDAVVVAAAFAARLDVAGFHEVSDDALGGPFGDTHAFCDVADAQVGFSGNGEQDVCVVGEEGPANTRC